MYDRCGCEINERAPPCAQDIDYSNFCRGPNFCSRITCKDTATAECREAVQSWGEAYRSAPNAADPKCYNDDPNYRASQAAAENCMTTTAMSPPTCSPLSISFIMCWIVVTFTLPGFIG